ncbi:hypothetical protein CYMTET_31000 [Cymbomonas tetramitiformis]|uniref:Uncharacterized protein n=1 Tax=Cymbomonas tetramitiformis TaxID=36881 RepID=A0AAE0KTM6_9CHLO|nr:hypothetical protein CYMTET_31000 [Cymbomonas tetramitiformis]
MNSPVAAVLRNAARIEKLDDPITPVQEILKRCNPAKLVEVYSLQPFNSHTEFLIQIATSRGKFKKGGLLDIESAARIVLQDWNSGKIPYYTNPPVRANEFAGEAAIVSSWGPEFNAHEVFKNEASAVIGGLPSMNDEGSMFIETPSAGNSRMDPAVFEYEMPPCKAAARGMEQDGMVEEEDVDHQIKFASAVPKPAKNASVDLYAEEGMFNPRAAKNAKKQKKKMQRSWEHNSQVHLNPGPALPSRLLRLPSRLLLTSTGMMVTAPFLVLCPEKRTSSGGTHPTLLSASWS